ncbi:hypothetical protein ACET3Z_006203 [Daucus carota]
MFSHCNEVTVAPTGNRYKSYSSKDITSLQRNMSTSTGTKIKIIFDIGLAYANSILFNIENEWRSLLMYRRREELEKNKELEKSKKMVKLQLAASVNLMKQMQEKTGFYNNALQSFMTKDQDEANLLLQTNKKTVVAIEGKRSRTSAAST